MQAPVFRSLRRTALRNLALALLVGGALGACDRHPATEAPESYGHGSARQKSYKDHRIDSSGLSHYSDTQGTEVEKGSDEPTSKPSPAGTPGGHFF